MNNRKNYGIAFIQVFISTPSPPTRTLLNKILKLSFGFRAARFFLSRDYSPEKRAKSLNLLSRSIHSFLSSCLPGGEEGKKLTRLDRGSLRIRDPNTQMLDTPWTNLLFNLVLGRHYSRYVLSSFPLGDKCIIGFLEGEISAFYNDNATTR